MVLKEYRFAVIAGLIGLPTEHKKGKKTPPKPINMFKSKIPIEKVYSNTGHMPSP